MFSFLRAWQATHKISVQFFLYTLPNITVVKAQAFLKRNLSLSCSSGVDYFNRPLFINISILIIIVFLCLKGAQFVFCCIQALKTLGYGHILNTYLLGLGSVHLGDVNEIREIQFEAACRSCKWELDVITRCVRSSNERSSHVQYRFYVILEASLRSVFHSYLASVKNIMYQYCIF